jgi:hypothetical protein
MIGAGTSIQEREPMTDTERERLNRRRTELLEQLSRVNADLHNELDVDIEEQAIQIEQEEVAISMEHNLRKELNDIEDRLRESD